MINKFRGDADLLVRGWTAPTELTGRPVLRRAALAGRRVARRRGLPAPGRWAASPGVASTTDRRPRTLRVAVVRLPRISNFTDVDALAAEPGVEVRFATARPAWPSRT